MLKLPGCTVLGPYLDAGWRTGGRRVRKGLHRQTNFEVVKLLLKTNFRMILSPKKILLQKMYFHKFWLKFDFGFLRRPMQMLLVLNKQIDKQK